MRRAMRTRAAALLTATAACAVALGVSGCTGSSQPHPTSASATPRPGTTAAAGLQKWLKSGGAMPERKAVAQSQGTILTSNTNQKIAVKAEVLSVTRTPTTTELVWRLSTADGSSIDFNTTQLSQLPWNDSRLIGLEDTATKTTYHPYTMVPPRTADGSASECVCSKLELLGLDGTGHILYASMPPLPKDVSTVTVTIPGFPDMPGVPVRATKAGR